MRFPREIYIGSTNNLRKRYAEHNAGTSPSTKRYAPWRLVYYEAFSQEHLAREREAHLKNNGNPMRELKKRIGLAELMKSGKGFTLVELIVSLTIIGIITAVVMVSQSSFNKTLILANTAYDIALTIRSAQNYGIGSRATSGGAVNAGYGIHFGTSDNKTFILFADTLTSLNNSDCHAPPSSDPTAPDAQLGDCAYQSEEMVKTYTLANNMKISDFCALNGTWSCKSSNALTSLDIVFARPNSDAFMSTNGSYTSSFPITKACIIVTSPQGEFRYVSVGASGVISASAISCI